MYQDLASGEESEVTWTPTFFLNNERYGFARELEALVRAVTDEARR